MTSAGMERPRRRWSLVSAEIRRFPAGSLEAAKQWIRS